MESGNMVKNEAISENTSSNKIGYHFSSQVTVKFNPQQESLWVHWNPQPRPCFNLELLESIQAYGNFLQKHKGKIFDAGEEYSLKYTITLSDNPKAFNLGGDLELFIDAIENGEYLKLLEYGKKCIEVVYKNYIAYGLPLTTIALVQGLCLGGGFEAALGHHILIAEKTARFGFPEISFNLFPGMGAYSLLERRLGQRLADQLISSGKRYTDQEMFDLGVVDVLVEDGTGYNAVNELISQRQAHQYGLQGISEIRRLTQKLEYNELESIVEVWAKRAMHITNQDLKLMKRLARWQG
ncbi:crotonase/enoyl-CoA hydratase family protein [Nodularia spumigena]|uniref:crotonase/enoyl-CoA hydratase family protein n=1 Tax=Nodularia spumigena TaxID=70799 RepID=UPI00232B5872|nr:crotonase/enoyl-CoA hydratase family protein [Nodularia spumigena]MDB9349740.1 crotonase/enoyl-CoA hydratase family protein [Nodularia spumigena CS-588/01]